MYSDTPDNQAPTGPQWSQPLPPVSYADPFTQPGTPAAPPGYIPTTGGYPPAPMYQPAPAYPPQQIYPAQPIYHPQPILVVGEKSVGLAFLLAFLFGPLGMLYATVAGALIMICVSLVAAVLSLFLFGIPLFFTWIACIVWACIAAGNHNTNLQRRAAGFY
jgi:hypothetical protein